MTAPETGRPALHGTSGPDRTLEQKIRGTLLYIAGSPDSGSSARSVDQFPDRDDRRPQIVVGYSPVT